MTFSPCEIDGRTSLLGIFGDPVSHSLSPRMQNAALAAAGMNAVYLPLPVADQCLSTAVEALRAFGFVGVNVTIPHKEKVMPLLDAVDAQAQAIGAVNTIVNREGRLTGYNTDASGFIRSLRFDLGFEPKGGKVVLLGAGGACRAAIVALAAAGVAEIVIANRTVARARELVGQLEKHCPGCLLQAERVDSSDLAPHLAQAALLVNTSAVGLHGESFPDWLLNALNKNAGVYDMVYAQQVTPLLQTATAQGRVVADGRGMLVAQGEEAFALWFGAPPPIGLMRAAIFAN